MKKLTSKKSLEFMTIVTTVIGTMIGAGIYVKNDNMNGHVLGNMANPYLALIGWAIIGVICMAAVMIFMEIASATAEHGNGTVSSWTKMFLNRKVASAVSIYYITIYLPINYAFFADLVINYVLTAAGQTSDNLLISKGGLTALYILVGILFIAAFSWMNSYKRLVGKKVEIIGTIVKFLPLILVLIAIFVPDTTWAVIFNNKGGLSDKSGNQVGKLWHTSFNDVKGMQLFSGFVPILFAFNGFIYAANMQKETEHKDVVAKGIFVGVLFTTIFYIIISVALFLGSTDGSVVGFFDYLIDGLHKPHPTIKNGLPYFEHHQASIIVSNVILSLVCIMGLNSYTLTGTNFINTDANAGIIWSNNKFVKTETSGMIQMALGILWLVILEPIAIYTGHADNPGYYMDLAGNAGAVLGFTCYDMLIILAMINRFKKKVKVKKINDTLFWICSPFSVLCLTAILIFSYLQFFGALSTTTMQKQGGQPFDLPNCLGMAISLAVIFVLWVVNEILFKWKPFDLKKVEDQEKTYLAKMALSRMTKGLIDEVGDNEIDVAYETLQISESATDKEIKQAYKVLYAQQQTKESKASIKAAYALVKQAREK